MTITMSLPDENPLNEGLQSDVTGVKIGGSRLQHWANAFLWRLDNDYDAVVAFTGPEGTGKSTCAWLLAHMLDPSFHQNRVGFNTTECIEISKDLDPKSIATVDEGVEGLYNRDHARKENKKWQKWMMVSRQRNLGVFLCYPRFLSLELYMREFRVWSWVEITSRGKAHFRVRNWSYSVEHEPNLAFPVVAAMRFPPVEKTSYTDGWEELQERKWNYVQSLAEG